MAKKDITRKDANKAAKAFNAEKNSLNGLMKACEAFYAQAQPALQYCGINRKKDLTCDVVIGSICDELKTLNEKGFYDIKVWRKVYDKTNEKSKSGNKVTTTYVMTKGKRVYHWELGAVSTWSINLLMDLHDQSANHGAMPAYDDDDIRKYWEKKTKETSAPKNSPKGNATEEEEAA